MLCTLSSLGFALLAVSLALWEAWRLICLYRDGRRTTGVVVRFKEEWHKYKPHFGPPESFKTEWPVIQYTDAEGITQEHEFVTATTSRPSRYTIGQTVPIFYDPGNPKLSRIDHFWQKWGVLLLFLTTSAISGGLGFIFLNETGTTPPRPPRAGINMPPARPPEEEHLISGPVVPKLEATFRMMQELAEQDPEAYWCYDKMRRWWDRDAPTLAVGGTIDLLALAWRDPQRFRELCEQKSIRRFLDGPAPSDQPAGKKLSPQERQQWDSVHWQNAKMAVKDLYEKHAKGSFLDAYRRDARLRQ